jgi:methionyl-tRNA formyltransferase
MTEALDEGDIIHQKKLEIVFADTANTLYQKALELEKEVFYEAYEELLTQSPKRLNDRRNISCKKGFEEHARD